MSINQITSQINADFGRSDTVQEIISAKPPFIVRWGNFIFLILFVLAIVACWFIRYPDVIRASAKLISINNPKAVIAYTSGKLERLFMQAADTVQAGQVLGYIESTASFTEVLNLEKQIDTAIACITHNNSENLERQFTQDSINYGELQTQYQTLRKDWNDYEINILLGGFQKKKVSLLQDLSYLEKLHDTYILQKKLLEKDLNLAKKTLEVNKYLKDQKVISEFDLRSEESKTISKELTLPGIETMLLNNEILQNSKLKELDELGNSISNQRSVFLQSLVTFKSQLYEWKRKFVIVAPASGKIAFETIIQERQQVTAGQPLCYINPIKSEYYVDIIIPQINFGKVFCGQKVIIKLDSYPFQEFGSLSGNVISISQISTEKGISAYVGLKNQLNTTQKKTLVYRVGLTGTAEIITKDLNLLERLIYNISKILRKE